MALSYLAVLAARKVRLSSVVPLILVGLFMGISPIREVAIGPNSGLVCLMGDIGLLALMFLAGLETSWHSLYRERRDAVFIASFTAVVPFLIGFAVFIVMGFPLLVSSIVGICMSVTAEATRAGVLLELKKLKTRVGAAMMGAGIIDDVFGLGMFMLVACVSSKVYLTEDLLIAGAILIFFAGIAAQRSMGREHRAVRCPERLLMALVVPFFFVSIGLNFDIGSVLISPVLFVVLAVAVLGKHIGSVLTKPFIDFRWRQLHLIGWAMNSRGAVELALALIAFREGLIPSGLYSSLVITAIATTLVFPLVMTRIVRRDPGIMD